MLLSNNSQLILRHSKKFEAKKVFFSGNIQDDFPLSLSTISTKINLQRYNDYIILKKKKIKILMFIIIY